MKLMIDFGHGGSDPGAVKIIREAQYTLSYGIELGSALKQLGFDVAYTRTIDTAVSLSQRVVASNNWKADYFISLHFNAGGGIGLETYAVAPGGKAEKLARAVQDGLISSTGSKSRGVKFATFYVIKNTAAPAILIEGGFVDSATDSSNIKNDAWKRKFIQGATKGICSALGVAWRDVYVHIPAPVVAPPAPSVMYRIILDNKQIMAISDMNKAVTYMKEAVNNKEAISGIVQRNDGANILEYQGEPIVVVPPVVVVVPIIIPPVIEPVIPNKEKLAINLMEDAIKILKEGI